MDVEGGTEIFPKMTISLPIKEYPFPDSDVPGIQ